MIRQTSSPPMCHWDVSSEVHKMSTHLVVGHVNAWWCEPEVALAVPTGITIDFVAHC